MNLHCPSAARSNDVFSAHHPRASAVKGNQVAEKANLGERKMARRLPSGSETLPKSPDQLVAASCMILTIVASTSCATPDNSGRPNIPSIAVGFMVASIVFPPSV
jgi:hypothetical protein